MPDIRVRSTVMDSAENYATRTRCPVTVATPRPAYRPAVRLATPASGNGPQLPHNRSGSWMNNPDRGFGSNHVDFGGITCPASATATSSSMLVG